MICFTQVLSIFAVFAVLAFPFDQALGEGSGDATSPIGGSGNGEILDGSGNGEVMTEIQELPPECTPEYAILDQHTMCFHDKEQVTKSGVSEAEQQIILGLHNCLRGKVEPPATDMFKLVWDDNLAAVAQKWAKQCTLEHDKNRAVPAYGVYVGQNIAAGYSSWERAVMGWYNEVSMFRYGEDPNDYLGKGNWTKIGHYTQVVQDTTISVGCGYAECSSSKMGRFYVCNYAPGQTRISNPYIKGDRCSACPKTCKDGICDCGGKICRNHGTLDIATCTCSCLKIYSGPNCEITNCPTSDSSTCWRDVFPKHCKVSWVRADCPFMCGICGGPDAATPPPVFVSKYNCTYKGQRPSLETCSSYGDNGADKTFCESRGGDYGCSDCIKYSNVKTDHCPVMCGLCDGPCDGKNCKNGGKLDRDTCQCTCKVPYDGETCEKVHCPDTLKDSSHCWKSFQPKDCVKYANIPSMCPWMCGLCGPEGATPPPVFQSKHGCTFKGKRPSKADCATYGRNGVDIWACESKGGVTFGCPHCEQFSNVGKEFCPVMCGLCDP